MDISNDHVRRELGELGRQHDTAMKGYTQALDRMVNEGDLSDDQKDEFVLGGLNRRRFLKFGGVTIASAAIFAACGSSSKTTANPTTTVAPGTTTPSSSGASTTTPSSTATKGTASDLTILRTASSLEFLAVAVYKTAIGSGLVKSAAVAAAAKDFMAQHMDHAEAFVAATKAAGGTPFLKPNPVIDAQVIKPALPTLKNQTDVLQLAWTLENAAAQTYVSTVGAFDNHAYDSVAASISGVESRHMSVIGGVLMSMKYPTYTQGQGFFSTAGAVKAGTGV